MVAVGIGIGSARSPHGGVNPEFDAGTRGNVAWATTPHLEMSATLSRTEKASEPWILIKLDIRPKARMHLYAPGGNHRPVAVRIEPLPILLIEDVVYPKPADYFLESLNEHAQVYSEPFRLELSIRLVEPTGQKPPRRLTVKGALEYQACDDKVCYVPTSVPLQWTIRIKR